MIQVSSNELVPGMILARSLFRDNGDLLLARGYPINKRLKERLIEIGYSALWIEEKGTESIIPENALGLDTNLKSLNQLKSGTASLNKVIKPEEKTKEGMQKILEDPSRFKNIIQFEPVQNSVHEIIESLMQRDSAVINLDLMRSKDNFLYQHAIDVTVTSLILATKFQFNIMEMEELALGCLLMDMGLTILPKSLQRDPQTFTFEEWALYKEHPLYGFTILKENGEVPLTSAHVAFQHHESQDGSGYPRMLTSNNEPPAKRSAAEETHAIHRYAEIASVADAYVHLVSPPYSIPALSPENAIRKLIESAGSQFNKSVVEKLVEVMPIYPVGSRVMIIQDPNYQTEGYTGVVSQYHEDAPGRPAILLLFDNNKKKISPMPIDLLEEPDIEIKFVVLN